MSRLPLLRAEWSRAGRRNICASLVRAAQEDDLDAVCGRGDGHRGARRDALGDGQRVPLGVLPVGSGNDFARDLASGADRATARR